MNRKEHLFVEEGEIRPCEEKKKPSDLLPHFTFATPHPNQDAQQ